MSYQHTHRLWQSSHPWLPVPLPLLLHAPELGIEPRDLPTLLAIAAGGFTRDAWPVVVCPWTRLADALGQSIDTVRRSARRLADAGAITITPGPGPRSANRISLGPIIERLRACDPNPTLDEECPQPQPEEIARERDLLQRGHTAHMSEATRARLDHHRELEQIRAERAERAQRAIAPTVRAHVL